MKTTMKKLRLLFVILLNIYLVSATAQSYTQKWNDFYKRTEYFDSKGNLQGWSKYNDYYKRLEFFDRNGKLQRYEKQNDYYKPRCSHGSRGGE